MNSGYKTYIDSNGVYSGSLTGINIYGANYYSLNGNSQMILSDIIVGGQPLGCGMTLYRAGGNTGFKVESITLNTKLYGLGNDLFLTHNGTTYPEGAWNFQFATVSGLTAKFG